MKSSQVAFNRKKRDNAVTCTDKEPKHSIYTTCAEHNTIQQCRLVIKKGERVLTNSML